MRLFFLTIPKPLKQHPILKKITHSAVFKDLGEKLPDPSNNKIFFEEFGKRIVRL
jgi:hypothetical protein